MSILHLTHYDLDGIGCEIILKSIFKNIRTIYLNRKNWDIQFKFLKNIKEDNLIITDWQLTQHEINEIQKNNFFKRIIYIDHHKLKEDLIFPSNTYYLIDENYCATELTAIFFNKLFNRLKNKNILKKFIKYVCDYDLWKLKYKESLILQFNLEELGNELFLIKMMNNLKNNKIINDEFKKIYELRLKKIKQYITLIQDKIIEKNGIAIIPSFKFLNMITYFVKKYKIFIFVEEKKNFILLSLRSRDKNINLFKIFQILKRKYPEIEGGGHDYAIGMKINDYKYIEKIVKEITKEMEKK